MWLWARLGTAGCLATAKHHQKPLFRDCPNRSVTVLISASRPSKRINPDTGQPIDESFIPERYNTKTELSADVVAERTNTFDFRLQSSCGKQ